MRIVHTSDWHLGKTLEGFSRIPEQKEFIEELHQIVEEQKVHLVLIAGDVYDVFNPSAEAEDLFYYALEKLADNGRRGIVVIAGNHDNPERIAAPEYLARHHGITLVGFPKDTVSLGGSRNGVQRTASGPGWVRLKVPGCDHEATLVTLAYPSEVRLGELFRIHFPGPGHHHGVSTEKYNGIDNENANGTDISTDIGTADVTDHGADDGNDGIDSEGKEVFAYRRKIQEVLRKVSAQFRDDTVNIIVSHLLYGQGVPSDSERILSIGGINAIQSSDLPASGVQYVALGHLHRPQSFHMQQGYPVYYSGSPLAYSFSEAGQTKRVVLLDIEPGKEARVSEVPLKCGLPLVRKTCQSYEDALIWCSQPENGNQWVEMEIIYPHPLGALQMRELRERHKRIVTLKVTLPSTLSGETGQTGAVGIRRLAELSLIEKFVAFYKLKNASAEPAKELLDLFVELTQDIEEMDD
ncbi:MAG: exonuclease subunit SbcD [bacterium]